MTRVSSTGREIGLRARVRPVVLLLVTLLLALTGTLVAPPPAQAAEEDALVTVQLEALDPALPGREDTVTLRGTAQNTSDRPITAAQAVLWYFGAARTDPADLEATAAQDPAAVWGTQLWQDGAYQRLTEQSEDWLPGQTRSFTVSAPVSSFGFSSAPGAFLIGIQVVGRHDGATLATVGQARVWLPLGRETPAATVGTNTVVSAVLLSSQPSMTEPGIFVDDHLAAELAPTGRLSVLLRAAGREQASWLIDPALIDEVTAMTGDYIVRAPDGEHHGIAQEAARAWLAAYADLDRARGFRVPYAVPDLTMAQRNDLTEIADHATAAAQRTPGMADLPLIGYAAGGKFDNAAITLAETGQPVAILAATGTSRGALLTPVGTAPIVNFSPATTAGGPGPGVTGSMIQTRQRLLAESFLTAMTADGTTTVRVITSAAAADAETAADAPWLRRMTLPDLLTQQPQTWTGTLPYGDTDRAQELNPDQVDTLQEIVRGYDAFAEMLVDSEANRSTSDAALARTASSWWRGNRPGFNRFAAPQTETIHRLWSQPAASLSAQRSVIMSGQSGSFPMTVTNNLDQAIRVTLTFDSFQPQRLSIPPMTDIMVPPRQGVTVNVQPQAVSNGPVRISAQVTTPGGTPVSNRAWLTVEATNFGRVGWVIVVVSGIVLLTTTALRIRQVRREWRAARRRREEGEQ